MKSKSTQAKLILNVTSLVLRLFLNVIFYVLVIMAVVKLSTMAYNFTYQIFGNVTVESGEGRNIEISIQKGESTMNIAAKLERSRVVVDKYSFFIRAKLTKQKIIPGVYVVNTAMTYDDIFDTITNESNRIDKDNEKE